MPKIAALEEALNKAYNELKKTKKTSRRLKWPTGIDVSEDLQMVIVHIKEDALKSNMQGDKSAFEGWILALKELVYKDYSFTVEFKPLKFTEQEKKKNKKLEHQHYQRFLFRLSLFDSLFGKNSLDPWFELNDEQRDLLATECKYNMEKKLLCNSGIMGRGNCKDDSSDFKNHIESSESALEWTLCKDGTNKDCLPRFLGTSKVYRQFPIGIFHDVIASDNAIFSRGKACIDLVADGETDNSFWIFELKKKGNKSFGILSELLFYTAIVRDMISGKVELTVPKDKDCYDPTKLSNKKLIHACFLAPDFHPLLLDKIISRLNKAWKELNRKEACAVNFRKELLCEDDDGNLKIQN